MKYLLEFDEFINEKIFDTNASSIMDDFFDIIDDAQKYGNSFKTQDEDEKSYAMFKAALSEITGKFDNRYKNYYIPDTDCKLTIQVVNKPDEPNLKKSPIFDAYYRFDVLPNDNLKSEIVIVLTTNKIQELLDNKYQTADDQRKYRDFTENVQFTIEHELNHYEQYQRAYYKMLDYKTNVNPKFDIKTKLENVSTYKQTKFVKDKPLTDEIYGYDFITGDIVDNMLTKQNAQEILKSIHNMEDQKFAKELQTALVNRLYHDSNTIEIGSDAEIIAKQIITNTEYDTKDTFQTLKQKTKNVSNVLDYYTTMFGNNHPVMNQIMKKAYQYIDTKYVDNNNLLTPKNK